MLGVSWRQVTIAAGDSLEIPAPNYSPVVLREVTVEGASAIFLAEYSTNVFTALKSPKFEQVFSITKTSGAHISVTNIANRNVTAYYRNL